MTNQDEEGFTPGTRVHVQMNGVRTTYEATVIEPTAVQRSYARHPEEYVWVRRDDGTVVMWKPSSLTRLASAGSA